jgi:predicted AAA+ superfamily ATPase
LGGPKIRAVKKEQKHYHYDWALPEGEAQKLENLVACHLLKWVHFMQDTEGQSLDLRYFRDSDGREVDFVILEKNKPIYLIEVKSYGKEISPHLRYLKGKYPSAKAVQVHLDETSDFISKDIRSIPVWKFLAQFV